PCSTASRLILLCSDCGRSSVRRFSMAASLVACMLLLVRAGFRRLPRGWSDFLTGADRSFLSDFSGSRLALSKARTDTLEVIQINRFRCVAAGREGLRATYFGAP